MIRAHWDGKLRGIIIPTTGLEGTGTGASTSRHSETRVERAEAKGGGTTLLDNTIFTLGAGMGDGTTHQYNDQQPSTADIESAERRAVALCPRGGSTLSSPVAAEH